MTEGSACELNNVRQSKPHLRGHHHQIHVAPARVVFGRGELVGVSDDEPDGVDAPGGQHETEDGDLARLEQP